MVAPNSAANKNTKCAHRDPHQPIQEYCLYCKEDQPSSTSISTDIKYMDPKKGEDIKSSTQSIKRLNKYYRNAESSPIESLTLPNVPKVPQNSRKAILVSIINHFNLDKSRGKFYYKFESLHSAKTHFLKKFGYIMNDDTDVMKFQYPDFLKNSTGCKAVKSDAHNLFSVKFGSIKKLFNEKWLDDLSINFVLECFNIYMASNVQKGTMPRIMFGKTYDKLTLVPSKDNQHNILAQDLIGTSSDPEQKKIFTRAMKKWYESDAKGSLQKFMDFSQNTNIRLNQYGVVANIMENHWVYLRYVNQYMKEENKPAVPCVMTYDSLHKKHKEVLRTRCWFAKFFGLSIKEQVPNSILTDKDFDGSDMAAVESFEYPSKCQASDLPSIIEVSDIQVPIYQLDGINCGIYSLIRAMKDITDAQDTIKICDLKEGGINTSISEELMDKVVKQFRLVILSLIDDVFDILYEKEYDMYNHVLKQNQGMVLNGKEIHDDHKKWILIQKMFQNGHFQFDGKNKGPNEIFRDYSVEKITEEYNIMTGNKDVVIIDNPKKRKKPSDSLKLVDDNKAKKQKIDLTLDSDDSTVTETSDAKEDGKELPIASNVARMPTEDEKRQYAEEEERQMIELAKKSKGKNLKRLRRMRDQDKKPTAKRLRNASSNKNSKSSMNSKHSVPTKRRSKTERKQLTADQYSTNIPKFSVYREAMMTRIFTFNVSNTYISNDIVRDRSREKDASYIHPRTVVDKIVKQLTQRFVLKKPAEPLQNRFETMKELKSNMKQFYTYFLMDAKNKDDPLSADIYDIKASMIIEPCVELNRVSICLIHFLCINFGMEQHRTIKSFMYHVFKEKMFREMPVFIVYDNPLYDYKVVDAMKNPHPTSEELFDGSYKQLLLNMSFKESPTVNMDDILTPGSVLMQSSASSICTACKAEYISDYSTTDYRILMINNRQKSHARFESRTNDYAMFSHPFSWCECTPDDILLLTDSNLREYKKNPDVEFLITGRGGYRKDFNSKTNEESVKVGYEYKESVRMFLQKEYSKVTDLESTCTWLSACLLATTFDTIEAKRMMKLAKQNPEKFEWMYLFKPPKGSNSRVGHKLCEVLMNNTPFYLEKVKGVNKVEDRLAYILDSTTTGKYICQLKTNAHECSHSVGIDCDNALIYDCMQNNKLPLNMKSLKLCCGEDQNGIKAIGYWGKFVYRPKKKV